MTVEEAKRVFKDLKKKGMTDEDIAKALYNMYRMGKIDLEQFEALVKLLGFELDKEFKKKER